MIIVISGTPGTGKTDIAKALAEKLGWKLIELNKLAEEADLYEGYDEKRKCRVVDIEKMEMEISKLGGNYVLESHYAHDMPADIVIILRVNPGELRKRLEKRGWSNEKIDENVEAEIMEVCKTEALEQGRDVFEVDTTGKSAEEILGEIISHLNIKNKNHKKQHKT